MRRIDMSDQQGAVHRQQGGDSLVIENGGEVRVKDGGEIVLESGAALTVGGGSFVSVAIATVSYTAVAGDATADEASIDTDLDSIAGFIVQVFRAGVNVTADAVVTATGGIIKVADGGATYEVTNGDVINVIAWS
jgi:hypothetical protein